MSDCELSPVSDPELARPARPVRFVPDPAAPAEVRLRRHLDQHNVRESRRRLRRAAERAEVEAVAEAEDGPGQAFWQAIAAARASAELDQLASSSAGPPGAVAKSTGSALRAKSAGAPRPSVAVAPWRRPPPKVAAEAAPASPAVTERAPSPLTPSPDAADAADEPDAADADAAEEEPDAADAAEEPDAADAADAAEEEPDAADAADAAEEPDAADAAEHAGAAGSEASLAIQRGADYCFGRRGGRYFQYVDARPPLEQHGQL